MGAATLSSGTPFSNYTIAADLLGQWPVVDAAAPGSSSFTERFLAQGYNASPEPMLVDLSQLDNVTFASRLTTIFNTWIQIAQTSGPMLATSATPVSVISFEITACNWFFFTVFTLTSIFLILCCCFRIWLRYQISTPDILGYVSSSTIENHYVSIPVHSQGREALWMV
jgi:hypothetical protein